MASNDDDSTASLTRSDTRSVNRRSTISHEPFALPDRFRDGEDAHEDVTAPRTRKGQLMNQSFLYMIANAASNTNFNTTGFFEPPSTDGIGEDKQSRHERATSWGVSTENMERGSRDNQDTSGRTVISGSVPHLKKPFTSPRHNLTVVDEDMSTSQILPKPGSSADHKSLSKSEHETPLDSMTRTLMDESSHSQEHSGEKIQEQDEIPDSFLVEDKPSLRDRLARIFGFSGPEEVISEYACFLLQSVMLQGYMYLTQEHVCFYAYLPKRSNTVVKSGVINKRGLNNPKYHRYWFVLKGDILSYYSNAKDLYFPRGHFDLRSGLTVKLSSDNDDESNFEISTPQGRQQFRAESTASAQEWVKMIQRVIFRSHQDSDSVKISIPIGNIVDVEENPVMNFANTFKVKVVDNNGETYAVDEYFFSIFTSGDQALNEIRALVESKGLAKATQRRSKGLYTEQANPDDDIDDARPPSSTIEKRRRRRSSGKNALYLSSPEAVEYPRHLGGDTDGSESDSEMSEPDDNSRVITSSQILQRDDIFQQPTLQRDRREKSSVQRQDDTKVESGNMFLSGKSNAQAISRPSETPRAHSPQLLSEARKSSDSKRSETIHPSSSTSTLQELMRVGASQLQKASGLANLLKATSKRMGSKLATESLGYIDKVSTMWAGERVHYGGYEGFGPDEHVKHEDDEGVANDKARFRTHFALPESEQLLATYYCYLHRLIPVYGKLYVGDRNLCFRSLLPRSRTKMVLPFRDIETIDKEKGFRFGYSGLVVVVGGHEELFFEFGQSDSRDDCTSTVLRNLESVKNIEESRLISQEEMLDMQAARAELDMLEEARQTSLHASVGFDEDDRRTIQSEASQIIFDDPGASIVDFRPPKPMRITCLTVGSRGDVQPYIALCKKLKADGHKPKIATHTMFKDWIQEHGIDFAPVAGDPAEIMRLCVENDMFTYSFIKEARAKFLGWIRDLLVTAWRACQDCDLLIESPSAMAGIHIAEALAIPYFRAFSMPWTRTRSYPHAFAVPQQKLGGNYNTMTYVMIDNVMWQGTAKIINRWRTTVGLAPTSLDKLQSPKVPFLYNFSRFVVPRPMDFNHWVHVTGYWFLDEGENYEPHEDLQRFIEKAREDGMKLVYVGFGSVVVDDPAALTKTIVDSVEKAGVRCILSKGWSDRLEKKDTDEALLPEVPLPESIFLIKSAPHDWLFRQIDAAIHHGGSGTTGASLRAGIPTVIKPFFGDQFFFASRVEDLGVGKYLRKINRTVFARALFEITHDKRIIDRARMIGELIRNEDGVNNAVKAIYRELDYARSLIKRPENYTEDKDESSEEAWTLVSSESNIDTRSERGEDST